MVAVVVVLLGFVVVRMNEPNGCLLRRCYSLPWLLGDLMSWMSWAVLQWKLLRRVVLLL